MALHGTKGGLAVELPKSWEEVTSLTARLDNSMGKLATVTDALAMATKKNGQLEKEVSKLLKVRAKLVAAQAQADKKAALAAKAQGELAELQR